MFEQISISCPNASVICIVTNSGDHPRISKSTLSILVACLPVSQASRLRPQCCISKSSCPALFTNLFPSGNVHPKVISLAEELEHQEVQARASDSEEAAAVPQVLWLPDHSERPATPLASS